MTRRIDISSLNPVQTEWLGFCQQAYETKLSAFTRRGVSAVRLNLRPNGRSLRHSTQISLHAEGFASRILCVAFFDSRGQLVRFEDALLDETCEAPPGFADRLAQGEEERSAMGTDSYAGPAGAETRAARDHVDSAGRSAEHDWD